jgi:hypothetical protein
VGISKYDNDEETEFGEGFKAGTICTLLFLFIVFGVAVLAYHIGETASRAAQDKNAEEVRT